MAGCQISNPTDVIYLTLLILTYWFLICFSNLACVGPCWHMLLLFWLDCPILLILLFRGLQSNLSIQTLVIDMLPTNSGASLLNWRPVVEIINIFLGRYVLTHIFVPGHFFLSIMALHIDDEAYPTPPECNIILIHVISVEFFKLVINFLFCFGIDTTSVQFWHAVIAIRIVDSLDVAYFVAGSFWMPFFLCHAINIYRQLWCFAICGLYYLSSDMEKLKPKEKEELLHLSFNQDQSFLAVGT